MDLRADERGQPVQIGFILLLSFLILSFSLYQAVLVPQQNAQIEFDHFQDVETDVSQLQSDLTDAVATERTRSVPIDLGATYPARLVGINPPPASGTLRTNASGTVEFSGLSTSAVDVCSSSSGVSSIESRTLEYEPDYSEYEEPSRIAYEHTLVARLYASGSLYSNQSFAVTGGSGAPEINLRLLTGEVAEQGSGAAVVDLRPSRAYTTTVQPSSSFSVIVPSSLTVTQWRGVLPPGSTPNLSAIRPSGDRIEFEFEAGTYALSCAVVGLNSKPAYQPPKTAVDGPDAPPTASIDGLADNSTSSGQDSEANFTVTWNVTDDRGLANVSVKLLDSAGNTVAETSPTVSGTSASGTTRLTDAGGDDERYVIKVVVTDSTGQTDTESVTDVADGDPTGGR